MGRVLRYAIESNTEKETIEIKGPLATVFSDALAIALAKRKPGENKEEGLDPSVSLESQQQEVALMGALLQKIQHGGEEKTSQDPAVLYAVSGPEMTDKDFVDITTEVATNENPNGVLVFVDTLEPNASGSLVEGGGSLTNNGTFIDEPKLMALESAVVALGGRFYTSLEAMLKDF